MNYYSRNSPAKKKVNPPPGFLIPDRRPYHSRKISRVGIKSHFNLSARHSASASEQGSSQKSQQILLLEGDVLYVPAGDQILIEQQEQLAKFEQPKQEKTTNQQINVHQLAGTIDLIGSDNQQDLMGYRKNSSNEDKPQQQKKDKYFFRNYSFGDKTNSEIETENRKQPIIRKLFNVEMGKDVGLEARSRQVRNNGNKKYESQGLRSRIEAEESWSKIVKNFIRKRASSEIKDRVEDNEQHQKNQDEDKQKVIKMGSDKISKVEQHEDSGYFKQLNEAQLEQRQQADSIRDSYRNHDEIKIVQNDQEEPNQYSQVANNSKGQQEYNQQTQLQSPAVSNSARLVNSTISELPQKLIPVYLRIYQELERRQHEAFITIRRMKQTQQMVQLLIEAHRKHLHVDDYILEEPRNQFQQKIRVNREIIIALIRKLAIFY